jgi:hypothetical protein
VPAPGPAGRELRRLLGGEEEDPLGDGALAHEPLPHEVSAYGGQRIKGIGLRGPERGRLTALDAEPVPPWGGGLGGEPQPPVRGMEEGTAEVRQHPLLLLAQELPVVHAGLLRGSALRRGARGHNREQGRAHHPVGEEEKDAPE